MKCIKAAKNDNLYQGTMEKSIKKSYVGYLSGFINFKNSTTDVQYSAENFSIHKENNWCY